MVRKYINFSRAPSTKIYPSSSQRRTTSVGADAIGQDGPSLTFRLKVANFVRTSGALQARLMWVVWLALAVYVARPVEFVCCDHLDVPKSPI